MKLVKFKDSDHTYRHDGELYSSVSKVFKNFQEPFDSENKPLEIAYRKILGSKVIADLNKKHKDWSNLVVKDIEENIATPDQIEEAHIMALETREKWSKKGDDASEFGTLEHSKREEEDLRKGYRLHPWTGKKFYIPDIVYEMREKHLKEGEVDNIAMAKKLGDLPDGYYPELVVFNHDYKVAGQADMGFIETVGSTRYVDFDDWKTDQEITDRGFFYRNRGNQMLKFPLDHLHDCKKQIYETKISLYGHMMELAGYEVRNLSFTHLIRDPNLDTLIVDEQRYDLFYRRDEVAMMLEMFRKIG